MKNQRTASLFYRATTFAPSWLTLVCRHRMVQETSVVVASTMPMPLMCDILERKLGPRVTALDSLVALGTHRPMDDRQLSEHLGSVITARIISRSNGTASGNIPAASWRTPPTWRGRASTIRPAVSRVRVILDTGIPEERCRRMNLGYLDPATVNPEWKAHSDWLVVPRAGEMLYRLI